MVALRAEALGALVGRDEMARPAILRVDLAKADEIGSATALGAALSWLREKTEAGETVLICGPDAERILAAFEGQR